MTEAREPITDEHRKRYKSRKNTNTKRATCNTKKF